MAFNFIEKTASFFREGIWKMPSLPNKPFRNFFIEASRILIASIRGFKQDDCFLKASSLTFYTLLSIVPVLAVGFGIAKGFGFHKKLEEEFLYQFQEQPDVAHYLIQFSYKLLANVEGGLIAGIGVVVLFWTVFRLLHITENSLNDIWKVPQGRTWPRKITDYFTTMLLCPFFFAASSSLTIFITTELLRTARMVGYSEVASPVISFIFYALPYVFAWLLFAFVYIFMPNTKVHWRAALIAGIIAGTAYQILQLLFIRFQIGVSSYGTIYGSFAALPLFLIWLNMSWIIVLAGAEIAFHSEYDFLGVSSLQGTDTERTLVSEKALAVLFCKECFLNYKAGSPLPTLNELTKLLGINKKILHEVAEDLMVCGILSRGYNDDHEEFYLPAVNVHEITLKSVCDALDSLKEKKYFVYQNPQVAEILSQIEAYNSAVERLAQDQFKLL